MLWMKAIGGMYKFYVNKKDFIGRTSLTIDNVGGILSSIGTVRHG